MELTLVVAILGVVAIVVLPQLSATDPSKLDLAAEEIAETMRFARTEAMRLGRPMGFRQSSTNQRIRVFTVDTTTSPWTPVYDVYHPVSKKLWDIKLQEHAFAAVESMSSTRVFRGNCGTPRNVHFNAHGIARCTDPETVPLEHYDVTLTLGNHSRIVSLDGVSGKVTIQ